MKTLGVIPARYQSSRFPGKPLADIKGKSMIQRVYIQATQSKLDAIIVATDDQRIYDHCKEHGLQVGMTSGHHQSGTDRCAEVAKNHEADLVINIQGDEPFIHPDQINSLITLYNEKPYTIGTLVKKIDHPEDIHNPNRVKVIINSRSEGLYFSRQAIPFIRDVIPEEWYRHHTYYRHLGMYAYQRQTLLEISELEPTALEKTEKLEQLRWLDQGYKIKVTETETESPNIDTPEDLEKLLESF